MWCELQGQRPLLDAGVYLIVINRMEITSVLYRVDQACQPEQKKSEVLNGQHFINEETLRTIAQLVKNLPAMREIWVRSLHWEDPLETEKATHSSILTWRIPWTA